ncbi:exodeoxyribonuclease V subunit gamma [Saccharobesus litoralis]|uniref:RecBCD enzyme subunit RecC n=2 Tax=Saccharobesus litoralis TaxID=2172099 RepID=A0A2S0VNW9_9ALTE|nr:exodeoxyribonuclease V subunit gamma [Saccharobesus litoralis]
MLGKVLQHTSDSTFEKQHILVQHKGMQHWLLMQLAEQNGIAMNIAFEPPVGAIWSILRELDPSLTKDSPYKANILSWRIYDLLSSKQVVADSAFQQANDYWQNEPINKLQGQKRFQLAKVLADLYEQYQIYRPDWILAWSQGEFAVTGNSEWQAKLWYYLIQQEPRHPVAEMQRLINVIKQKTEFRPKQRVLFGFNSLPPLWLDFFVTLAEKQEMHLFLLSPCNEFWQDIQSEKRIARQRVKHLDLADGIDKHFYELGNPLLAALGQQGQAFLRLLYDRPQYELAAFELTEASHLLSQVQNHVLQMQEPQAGLVTDVNDQSINVVSCHSALREVQHLHDWLLQQMELDPSLTPKDVLVMCPSVEDYAPYIEAVFTRARFALSDSLRIPCSIADRSFSSNMTFVQLFTQTLQLPDSRFAVSQVIEMTRSPLVQAKFDWQEADIETLLPWLKNAAIHWGLDGQQKGMFALPESQQFTWLAGLEKLLLGFAYSDATHVFGDTVALPDVEGDLGVLLGKLMWFIDVLRNHMQQLSQPRDAKTWSEYLLSLLDDLFVDEQQGYEYRVVQNAIVDLVKWTQDAGFAGEFDLGVVQAYFDISFNQPMQSQHFMTGQVTFCSLIPMRSIPFKVIALLGMNDGDFPRQKSVNSLDLLAQDQPRLGDRSRRGDDRYLFLECLLSARDKLYISYQGRQIKDNSERQPSNVVIELIDYLEKYHAWSPSRIQQTPLHPFSASNYVSSYVSSHVSTRAQQAADTNIDIASDGEPAANLVDKSVDKPVGKSLQSYESGWLNLLKLPQQEHDQLSASNITLPTVSEPCLYVDLEDLIRFYAEPSRYFANKVLNLYLANGSQELQDSEPFAVDYLQRYQVQNDLVAFNINTAQGQVQQGYADEYIQIVKQAGHLPDNALAQQAVNDWQAVATDFAQSVLAQESCVTQLTDLQLSLTSQQQTEFVLSAGLPLVSGALLNFENTPDSGITADSRQVFWRLADAKGKDKLRLWLSHLMANSQQNVSTLGYYRSSKDIATRIEFAPLDNEVALDQLSRLINGFELGLSQPLLVDVAIAEQYFTKDRKGQLKVMTQEAWQALWQGNQFVSGLYDSPYRQHFWPQIPAWTDELVWQIAELYQDMFALMQIQQEAC